MQARVRSKMRAAGAGVDWSSLPPVASLTGPLLQGSRFADMPSDPPSWHLTARASCTRAAAPCQFLFFPASIDRSRSRGTIRTLDDRVDEPRKGKLKSPLDPETPASNRLPYPSRGSYIV